MKANRVLHIVALLIVSTTSLYSQKSGIQPLETSAMSHLYPKPERWSGAKYSSPRSLLDRVYFVGGANMSQTWKYNRELDSSDSGLGGRIGIGFNLAPVHSLEFGSSWNNLNRMIKYNSVDLSYLYNLSAYGERTEDMLPFELLLRIGGEYKFGDFNSAHVTGGLRLKYNVSPSIGVYLEPALGVCAYRGENSPYGFGDVTSSVSLGFSIYPGEVSYYSRRTMERNSTYWYANDLSSRKILLSIKSNLLFDIAMIPNIEVEFAIYDKWSFGAQAMCGWWLRDDNSRCWQLQAADIEGRYWFGDRTKRRALTGWFTGIFASAGFYDFQVENTQGIQGDIYVMAGVSGGYSMAIGRRMNMEFTAGVGYIVNDYQKYTVYESEYLVVEGSKMRFQSVFPAKVEVSLGWVMFKQGDSEKRSQSRREYKKSLITVD